MLITLFICCGAPANRPGLFKAIRPKKKIAIDQAAPINDVLNSLLNKPLYIIHTATKRKARVASGENMLSLRDPIIPPPLASEPPTTPIKLIQVFVSVPVQITSPENILVTKYFDRFIIELAPNNAIFAVPD